MIVKILSSSASFDGVSYNTDKVDKNTGELMAVRNFGALQGLANLRPEDYKNYLRMVSATNKAVKKPQFHAAISAEGRSYDKQQLTEIAQEWLNKMGYGDQPYLVVFHKDTANNHVHVVSTRVDRKGKKIKSDFERNRGLQHMNAILGIDEKHNAEMDIEKALAYSFSTRAQFMMILECQGYKISEKDGRLSLVKFGKVQGAVDVGAVTTRLQKVNNDHRKKQLAALLYKYPPEILKQKHGIVLLFHAKNGQQPYGYSVIDHAQKAVYKGGEILPLAKLLNPEGKQPQPYREPVPEPLRRNYYRGMLKAAMQNYPDIRQGFRDTGIGIYLRDDRYYLVDRADQVFIPLDQLLDENEYQAVMQAFAASGEVSEEIVRQHVAAPIIAASVDDEAVHGRKRRRKKNQ